jgi:hypothetical protein
MAFVVMSDAVNLWLDGNCTGDLARAIDEGFELLREL